MWITDDRAERDRVLSEMLSPLLSRDADQLGAQVCVGSVDHCAELLALRGGRVPARLPMAAGRRATSARTPRRGRAPASGANRTYNDDPPPALGEHVVGRPEKPLPQWIQGWRVDRVLLLHASGSRTPTVKDVGEQQERYARFDGAQGNSGSVRHARERRAPGDPHLYGARRRVRYQSAAGHSPAGTREAGDDGPYQLPAP